MGSIAGAAVRPSSVPGVSLGRCGDGEAASLDIAGAQVPKQEEPEAHVDRQKRGVGDAGKGGQCADTNDDRRVKRGHWQQRQQDGV